MERKSKIPEKGCQSLRKGRFSCSGYYYFITTTIQGKAEVLQDPRCANVVLNAIKWLEQQGKIEYVMAIVMPDHIHFVFALIEGSLASIMKSLKGFTARKINQILGRKGTLWQEQYYEHLIRKRENLFEIVKYCLNNPVRKGLVDDYHHYPYWICKYDF